MLTTLVMLMLAPPGPGKLAGEPPTDADILRALPGVARGVPFVFEQFRDDITIVKNQLGRPKVGPVRFYPIIGKAALVETNWECVTYYTETIQSAFPFPVELKKNRVQVVYIEKAELKR
jgi:hypothetical protein